MLTGLTFFQRSLLLHDMQELLVLAQWQSLFDHVLFPLTASLAFPARVGVDISMVDETRMRACNIVTKVQLVSSWCHVS